MDKNKFILRLLIFFSFLFLQVLPLCGQQLSVEAAVEKNQVFVGESFIYQIKVNGSESPEQPELKGFDAFTVSFLGGRNSSSQSITIINGQMSKEVSKAFIFQYNLSPKKTGALTIPSVMVKAEGRNLLTDPIRITVQEPSETGDYKLRLSLSRTSCYIDEPVTLTFTWYIGASVNNVSVNLPLFDDKRITLEELNTAKSPNAEYIPLPVNNRQVEFEHPAATTSYQGKNYRTLSFRRALIPHTAGQLALGKAFVQFEGVAGYRNVRDWFGGTTKQAYYNNFVIPSNSLVLEVKEVPATGKPVNYSGLIGDKFTLEVSAAPVEVKVGDPITLQIVISGPRFLNDARIPDLNTIRELTASFRIPADQSPGRVEGNRKIFTQTLRATSEEVTGIPEFEIPYFNSAKNRYEFLKSRIIPLKVEAGETKTFRDMEGMQAADLKTEIEVWNEGIAHNYEGSEILKNQALNLVAFAWNPLFVALLVLPVFAFLVLLYITRFRHIIQVDEADKKSKKAYSQLLKQVNLIESGKTTETGSGIFGLFIEEINKYLGSKLKIKGAALTFRDVETPLRDHKVQAETLDKLKEVYKTCEAGHYAGGLMSESRVNELSGLIKETIQEIERSFKK